MRIYVTHSTGFDFHNELYKPLRESGLHKKHEIVLPHEKSNTPFSSKEFMGICDLIFAEVSFPSTGQGIELGWADALEKPIVCFSKKGAKISSSLASICQNFVEYEDEKDLVEKLEKYLAKLS